MRGNPKSEIRNPTAQRERALRAFQPSATASVSDFGFRPSFGFRISDFGFRTPPLPLSRA